jgi:hypothetical protein
MQTMWFLSRTDKRSTVVLDEPDVYLHADLQRKLIKVIEGLGFSQSVIATHSSEIIGDVPFQNVTVVQKKDRISRPAERATQIQAALRGMGSLHSIQLAKVAENGLILFVEGDDKPFLTDIAYKMGARYFDYFSKIAIQEIKGKGNWAHALGAAKALQEASNGDIATALILDSDYMLDEQKSEFYEKSMRAGLVLKVWTRKEIENYFINPNVIARYVSARSGVAIDASDIEEFITQAELRMEEDVILSFSDVLQQATTPRIEPKTAFQRAKILVRERTQSGRRISHLGGGKEIISNLSATCQERYGVGFSPLGLCKETRGDELPTEVSDFIRCICDPSKIKPGVFDEHVTMVV